MFHSSQIKYGIACILGLLLASFVYDTAVFVFGFGGLVLSVFFILLLFRGKKDPFYLKLFLIGFLLCGIYAACTNYWYVSNPKFDFFMFPDQLSFYKKLGILSKMTFPESWEYCFVQSSWDYPLFLFVSYLIKDTFHTDPLSTLMLLKMQGVFLAALSQTFVYGSLRAYFSKSSSAKYALQFLFFGPLLFYSAFFLRDIHIAFCCFMAFYVILDYKNMKYGAIVIGVAVLLCYHLRPEHGTFLALLIPLYYFLKMEKTLGLVWSMFLIVPSLLIIVLGLGAAQFIQASSETMGTYISIREGYTRGVTAQLASLPMGFNYLTLSAFGQMRPFPFIDGMRSSSFSGIVWWAFPFAVFGVFWVTRWAGVVAILANNLQEFRKKIPKEVLYTCGFALLLILITAMNYSIRRMIGVYLPIYVLSCMSYHLLGKERSKNVMGITLFGLLILNWIMIIR